MSESIKHECGIAFIRLLQPLEYYRLKYNTPLYGLNKLMLMMEKQHNRGQDGAGIACIKLDLEPGMRFINRSRSNSSQPITDIFSPAYTALKELRKTKPSLYSDVNWLKHNADFVGELYLGHLRYGTFGKNSIETCHPFIRENSWETKNIVLAGNFNLTNVDELFNKLISLGQHPVETTDTVTILEKIGHFLDEENEDLYQSYKKQGVSKKDVSALIAADLDVQRLLTRAARDWDGGFVLAGMIGHGDAFVMRDPAGIRPAYYYADDEVVVVASERPAIMTTFNVAIEKVNEILPGNALIVKKDGSYRLSQFVQPAKKMSCSFERIYFSRGTDKDIYLERKKLGSFLVPSILKAIDYDLENTVFSYIPNTAAVAYYGMMGALEKFCDGVKKDRIMQAGNDITAKELEKILAFHPRFEKVAVKDMKLRTFITQDKDRDDLVAHVYDVSYGIIRDYADTIVVIDDSIVRGTTLRESIIRMLDRLNPKRIIIASSAPQIRYPDCYGIDMAKLNDFIAFRAAIALLHETKQDDVINRVYKKCKAQEHLPKEKIVNYVKEIYEPFTPERIAEKITQLLVPEDIRARVQIIFQSVSDLHAACPGNTGDWYFSGDYPTPGGNKVVNRSFINYIEKRDERGYQAKMQGA
ncbi:MAG TPA: class II glutamine amidotransferase [Bacteroidales bacterium]|nr:class II glutamine amidotransferase [Bacteroidales bacterium]HPB24273.1 class II glutamine amidotransferase [Bacteroidales bacterium]HPI28904.1 class II glutamine amidotransferase [Bacteroidales bacterium]HQN14868.1 class II glutamine amidotransferase [Bacteroidales bacterium]HQP14350.1 class II glutamine amidotransferase [Bacteroidales bacterium]